MDDKFLDNVTDLINEHKFEDAKKELLSVGLNEEKDLEALKLLGLCNINLDLYDEAKSQLNALVQKDNEYRKTLEERARVAREEEQQAITDYWNNVSKAITNRVINGYKLPESFTKVINGQKITRTPSDFYNYLSRATETDEEGNRMTGYQRDLSKLSNEELLNKEILDAWLMYTGGSYKDLADMAVQEANVKKLIVKSKQERANRTIKITKPKQSKVSPDDILL